MKKAAFILLLMLTMTHVKAQDGLQLDDLVGKWRLTKVEESLQREGVELSNQVFTPASYTGDIYFELFKCSSEGNLVFSGRMLEKFRDRGNIQLNENSNEVFFHGKQIALLFAFSWQTKPTEFVVEKLLEGNQQSAEKKMVKYYYKKE